MIRGTFANIRLRDKLAPGAEGGYTRHLPSGEQMTIYEAAQRYAAEGVPLLVIADKEYGSGSSRDWAAKGTAQLGVRAVLAASFERIHRSNLIGMGVLPPQFTPGEDAGSLGLTGEETYSVRGLAGADEVPRTVTVTASGPGGTREFTATVRIDSRRGGLLPARRHPSLRAAAPRRPLRPTVMPGRPSRRGAAPIRHWCCLRPCSSAPLAASRPPGRGGTGRAARTPHSVAAGPGTPYGHGGSA